MLIGLNVNELEDVCSDLEQVKFQKKMTNEIFGE
jgi:hypothetical protein